MGLPKVGMLHVLNIVCFRTLTTCHAQASKKTRTKTYQSKTNTELRELPGSGIKAVSNKYRYLSFLCFNAYEYLRFSCAGGSNFPECLVPVLKHY